ncbi:serine/threonine-protein kinase [Sphaerotilaceae bacterium SBD11-9]
MDERFLVTGICSEAGGMGSILHVVDQTDSNNTRKVLKYCKDESPTSLQRFQREVRLMHSFSGSDHVMTVHHFNVEHTPPYFVMDFYAQGDLFNLAGKVQSEMACQEWVFLAMLDCIEALHEKDVFHRDIKPQNFLFNGEKLVVSDLGLSRQVDSLTQFTRTTEYGGTLSYLPPEFLNGGFKHADALGDIFMLGKSFYALLTGMDPILLQLEHDQIPRQLRAIIDRCCRPLKDQRYQSIEALRVSLRHAYDAINGRETGRPTAFGLWTAIETYYTSTNSFSDADVRQFIDELQALDEEDAKQIALKWSYELFGFVADQLPEDYLAAFLKSYRTMVDSGDYGWSYAETITRNMGVIFYSSHASFANRTEALRIAIIGAHKMNRFAAMDRCKDMVASIDDDELAAHVHDLIIEYKETFIAGTDQAKCKSIAIRNALYTVHPPEK